MKKLIFSTLCTLTLALGAVTYSAQACDCDQSCQASCSAGKTEDCKCKDCECSKGEHTCNKECSHHKKGKAKEKAGKAKAATEVPATQKTN